jgi:hypothetical protein
MQTLGLLSIDLVPAAFSKEHEGSEEFNPKGFYDMVGPEALAGVHHDNYRGKAVKLFAMGLHRTPAEFVDAVLVCRRDKAKAIDSLMRIQKFLFDAETKKPVDKEQVEKIFDSSYIVIEDWVKKGGKPSMSIQFEDMVSDPVSGVEGLAAFLDLDVDTWPAIDNVERG